MKLAFVLYASHLRRPLVHDQLVDLLNQSRRNNKMDGLTGFLHIEDQIVLQYLEGPPSSLSKTIFKIRQDRRHDQFMILSEELIEHRFFDGWQMALVESATLSLFDLLGVHADDVPSVRDVNVNDLIALLSTNASYLRDKPSVA